jgi:hypothetical protein
MIGNDFPVRMAGQRLSLQPYKLAGLTPSDVTKRLRYQAANPSY